MTTQVSIQTEHTALPRGNFFIFLIKWLWALDTRAMELLIGVIILSRGLMILIIPASMSSSIYNSFLEVMSIPMWGITCVLAGTFQIAGVMINGHWRRSPILRCIGAIYAASFFAMLTVLFSYVTPPALLAISIYLPLSICNLWTAVNISAKV